MNVPDWIGKFFENRGWLGLVQHSSTNGLNVAGTRIDYETVTYAQFTAGGFNVATERVVYVSDVPADRSLQGGSFWRIVPSATVKRKLISEAVCYSTFADAIADFPIASYTGLSYRCGDVGDYNVRLISNGTRVKPESGIALIGSSAGNSSLSKTLANLGENSDYSTQTGTTSHTYTNVSKLVPAGLVQAYDTIEAKAWFRKSGTNASFIPVFSIGTNNVVGSDSSFYDFATATGAVDLEAHGQIKFISSSAAIAKRSNEIEVTAGNGSRFADRSSGLATGSDMYINIGISAKHISDIIYLLEYQFIWKTV